MAGLVKPWSICHSNMLPDLFGAIKELKSRIEVLEKYSQQAAAPDLSAAYPVGSIYLSVASTNPGTSLGFGTWVAFGTGRALVGIDTGQTEFNTVEKTGGAKTHTLTTGEIPAHNHYISANFPLTYAGYGQNSAINGNAVQNYGEKYTNNNTGGGGAHNNLQPYITCYMWKRTA